MDYEKKKIEALEELKQCTRFDIEPAKTILKLFPELEESDYVIKRNLINLLTSFRRKGIDYILCDRIQNWVEKQGEQNSTNKIKPKFKVGDTMRTLEEASDGCTGGMPVIVSIDEEYYRCNNESIAIKDQDNYEYPPMNKRRKYNFKEGDIVAADPIAGYPGPFVAIFREYAVNSFNSYCYVTFNQRFHKGQPGHDIENVHPATRGQRNVLFTKMKKAGYTWDPIKKELNKIE